MDLCVLFQIQNDLQYVKEDTNAVERHRIELYRARDRYSVKLRMLADDSMSTKAWSSSIDKNSSGLISTSHNTHGGMHTANFQYKKTEGKAQVSSPGGPQRKDAFSGLSSQNMSQSGLAVARKKRVMLQVCSYLTFTIERPWPLDCLYYIGFVLGNL